MTKQTMQAKYLQDHKAWNWQWPDNKGRWNTGAKKCSAPQCTRFTPTGPSKKTLGKRAAKALKGRRRKS